MSSLVNKVHYQSAIEGNLVDNQPNSPQVSSVAVTGNKIFNNFMKILKYFKTPFLKYFMKLLIFNIK